MRRSLSPGLRLDARARPVARSTTQAKFMRAKVLMSQHKYAEALEQLRVANDALQRIDNAAALERFGDKPRRSGRQSVLHDGAVESARDHDDGEDWKTLPQQFQMSLRRNGRVLQAPLPARSEVLQNQAPMHRNDQRAVRYPRKVRYRLDG